jgi:hypothetical protein
MVHDRNRNPGKLRIGWQIKLRYGREVMLCPVLPKGFVMSNSLDRLKNKPNMGHGHVFPRADGVRARCGGPGICKDCGPEFAQLQKDLEAGGKTLGEVYPHLFSDPGVEEWIPDTGEGQQAGLGQQAGSMVPGLMGVVSGLASGIAGSTPPLQDNSTGDRPDLPPYEVKLDQTIPFESDNYFPTNHLQVQQLVGKMLTHIEALGIPAGQEKAAKDLVKQTIYGWFANVQENSMTSYRGCIAPLQMLRHADGTERKVVWLAVGDHAVSIG